MRSFVRILPLAIGLLPLAMPSFTYAQGILPSSNEVHISTAISHIPVLIGEKVPENIFVLDTNGTKRTLLSYKASIEILTVVFLSPRCETDLALLPDLQRFYDSYKGWHVSFVAIDLGETTGMGDLQDKLTKAGVKIPVLRDPSGTIQHILKVTATPEILLMDEDGYLRYRGALYEGQATPEKKPNMPYGRNAMDAMIGHVEAVPQAEPDGPIGCPLE